MAQAASPAPLGADPTRPFPHLLDHAGPGRSKLEQLLSGLPVAASLAAFALVLFTVVAYLATIPRGKVPVKVGGLVLALSVGVALAALAIAGALTAGTASAGVLAPSAFAIVLGGFFLYLVSQRKVPLGELQVELGGPLLRFASTTSEGVPFDSADLVGTRTLLKFFRGGW